MAIIKLIKQADVLTGKSTEIHTGETVGEWLLSNYKGTGIQYAVFNSNNKEITTEYEFLCACHDEVKVIELPSATLGVAGIVAIVSLVISVAAVVLMPKPKTPPLNVNRNQQSPNNELGRPSNRARPFERIPDIRGKDFSIPDIIQVPYRMYEAGRLVEHAGYCVSRRQVAIDNLSDAETPIHLIPEASAGIYYPNNNPNIGSPDVQIGEPINRDFYINYRCSSVDGIDLVPPQDAGSVPVYVNYIDMTGYNPDLPYIAAVASWDITRGYFITLAFDAGALELSPDYYIGNSVNLVDWNVTSDAITYYDISGTYKILNVEITPPSPGGGPGYTLWLDTTFPFTTPKNPSAGGAYTTTVFSTPYNEWHYLTRAEVDRGFISVYAPNGLQRDTGATLNESVTVEFSFDVEGVDKNGDPDGYVETYTGSISGNNTVQKGVTVEFVLPYKKRFRCRVKRTTDKILLSGSIVQNIKLHDIYGLADLVDPDFGDVTIIQAKTIANQTATSLKERQITCDATEMLYVYEGAGVFAGSLTENVSAVQSYITDFIDPVMGGRPIAELDADGLLDLETEINTYFGNTKNSRFCYTLDSTEITFQEYTYMLFDAINCIAYRDGSIVRAHFEKQDATPTMLFTHRSKIPDTEVYTRNFNFNQLPDGIDFKYKDPTTHETRIIKIPADGSAVRPKSYEIPGIQNFNQAYKRAWREYNKIKYGREVVTFEATAEARYLKPGAVFSIVRGNRSNTTDGEVLDVSGSVLTLSQDVEFVSGDTHSIVLKLSDGTTESIICTAGPTTNSVTLTDTPSEVLRTELIYQRRTEFSFGNEDKLNAQLFIAREIDMANKYTVKITAVNYTDDYYSKDVQSLRAFSSGFSLGFN